FHLTVSIPGTAITGDFDDALIWSNSTLDPFEYTNASIFSMVPYNTDPPWFDDMETGVPLWTYTGSGVGADAEWHITSHRPYSPVDSWYYGIEGLWKYYGPNDGKLMTPYVNLPAGGSYAKMDVWHWYDFELYWDGGVVDVTTDNGTTWNRLTPERGYDGTLGTDWGNVLEGQDAFTGASGGYVNDVFDLSPYIGNVIKLRFWAGADKWIGAYEGWYIDDITIQYPEYGAVWTPESQFSFGDAGDTKSYDMALTNMGRFTDTFTFSTATTLGWPVTVYDDTWAVVADSGPMDTGTSKLFHANVTIPAAALKSDSETTIITATSTLDPSYWADETLTTFVTDPILLVSDDWEFGIETFYMDALDNNQIGDFYKYDWVDTHTMGTPSFEAMQAHEIVIWHTVGVGTEDGNPWDSRNPLDETERTVIGQYLDGGGLMYLSSGGMPVAGFFNGYGAWTSNYFGISGTHWWPWPRGSSSPVYGIAGNPIGDGLTLNYHMGDGHPDCLGEGSSASGGAEGQFETSFEEPDLYAIGTTLDNDIDKRVFFSFDLADISGAADRDELMRRVLKFLSPVVGLRLTPSTDQSWYGLAGTDATYNLNIENIGITPDSFDLSLDSGVWAVTFYDTAWTPIVNTGLLNPGESIDIYINVSIPGAAVPGDLDTSLLRVTSTVDGTVYEITKLETSVPVNTPYNYDATVVDGWTTSNGALWHLEGSRFNSAPTSWAYNDGVNYSTGARSVGSLYSPWITLPVGCLWAQFSWWEWRET
ncbi:MAG: immune inhibitor A, partial [Thermoplasmata archaeon]|nr:immune inhibitor A [Thermoplasmata archaeon]